MSGRLSLVGPVGNLSVCSCHQESDSSLALFSHSSSYPFPRTLSRLALPAPKNRGGGGSYSSPILTSSPMPQPSLPAPCISRPTLVPRDAASSSLAASLALLERSDRVPFESVTRRRREGGLKRVDLDDDESIDTASSSSFSPLTSEMLAARSAVFARLRPSPVPVLPVADVPAWDGVGDEGRGGRAGGGRGEVEAGVGVWSSLLDELEADAASGSTSTSSASRYHFRRRVQRPQPSWPRRPFCHCSSR